MKILVACEESQAVTKEFRRLGHETYSCDLYDCSGGHPEWHIKGDCLPILNGNVTFRTCDGKEHCIDGRWDMIIGHPPCTYLSNAGARFLYPQGYLNHDRLENGLDAREFFMKIYNADCDRIAVENPVPSGIYELPEYTQAIQPYEYGHPYTKKTCLWLKGLPKLIPTNILPTDQRESTKVPGNWFNAGGKERQKNRAKTFPGIAKAMAEQWGNLPVIEKKPAKKSFLRDYQLDAVNNMRNGCILNGGVGSGKSRTGLYYYFKEHGGSMIPEHVPMKNPRDLYIITTAKKRDSLEWREELVNYFMSDIPEENIWYKNKIVVDSWNNIQKYKETTDAFFIFDEDRVTGSGAWVKAFLKIAKKNKWIILSATPGDTWSDYIPVFIANGFYKNKTEFTREHIVFSRFTKFPKIDKYIATGRLIRYRNQILVDMDFTRKTISHHEDVFCKYDIALYKDTIRKRWDPYKNEPIQQAAGLCYILRKIVNSDESREVELLRLLENKKRAIIFYNFDYELDTLLKLAYKDGTEVAQWNGHKHQPVPDSDKWVYLVQYTAGCEGWNCIKTDTIILYSQTYSYRTLEQACGRIDRMNTPYTDLYYYHLRSRSGIDLAITQALNKKKNFNEGKFISW